MTQVHGLLDEIEERHAKRLNPCSELLVRPRIRCPHHHSDYGRGT